MLKTRTWIILTVCAAAVCLTAGLFLLRKGAGDVTAVVTQDGEVLSEIHLQDVKKEYSFTVEDPDGHYNVISVRPGMIRVSEADCPDQICVKQGWVSGGVTPIVCLPHKLMITFEGRSETDAVAG